MRERGEIKKMKELQAAFCCALVDGVCCVACCKLAVVSHHSFESEMVLNQRFSYVGRHLSLFLFLPSFMQPFYVTNLRPFQRGADFPLC